MNKLKINALFISIRWKLVSTYILLIVVSLFMINVLIQESLVNQLVAEKKESLISRGNIAADQIASSLVSAYSKTNIDYIKKVIKELSLKIDSRVLVLNRSSVVVVDSYDDYKGSNQGDIAEVVAANNGISSSGLYKFDDGMQIIYTGTPIYFDGELIGSLLISSSPDEVYNRIDQVSRRISRVSFVVVVISLIISIIFADILSKPLEKLTMTVRAVGKENLNQQIDISSNDELGELSDSINQMVTQLYRVDEMRKQFVSNVSHELKTPITSLKIIAETLVNSKPQDIAVYDDFMRDINGELDRLNEIIDTLLTLSKLEHDSVVLDYKPTAIGAVVSASVNMLKPIAEKKQVELVAELQDEVTIYCDSLKIRHCIGNIINNAIKYTASGGRVCVRLSVDKDDVLIAVEDTGIGIPKEALPSIFDRFYRVDSARSRQTGGTGLGLSIALKLAQQHGGKITVESEEGVGTTFVIVIPKKMEHDYDA